MFSLIRLCYLSSSSCFALIPLAISQGGHDHHGQKVLASTRPLLVVVFVEVSSARQDRAKNMLPRHVSDHHLGSKDLPSLSWLHLRRRMMKKLSSGRGGGRDPANHHIELSPSASSLLVNH